MTRDQIIAKWETLTPRERDAWVAEVVTEITPEYDEKLKWSGWKTGPNSWSSSIPFYSTEIAAAWTIVDANKTEFLVRRRLGGSSYRAWIMTSVYNPDVGVCATAKTAPEAISLAAIIAKLTLSV